MAIGALRVPVRIVDSYVATHEAQRLFPNFPSFLSREDVLEVWPGGLITHEKFHHNGSLWRLVKRPMANGNSVYMAVLDDSRAASHGTASAPSLDTAHRLRSLPLDAFNSHDISDVAGGCSDIVPAYAHAQPHHAPSAPLTGHGSLLPRPPLSSSSMRDRNGSYASVALSTAPPSGPLSVPSFMTDLLAATESPTPLDRYKAIVRLLSVLNRMRESQGLPQLTPRAPASATEDPAWESPDAQELVRQTLMVGECLAKFGTAEFVDGRNNSSRAITTKDYAKLLRMFLEGQGALFRDDFIARLPLALQDEALTVRTLLQTRCETNDMLFNQLIKHVGQESANGGAVVYNTSTVSANPTNHMLAAPRTFVNTVSNAWSKADVKRRTQMGAVGAVAVVALWVLKRRLFGGGGSSRARSRREEREDSDYGSSGGRWSRRIRGSSDLAARLLDERLFAERMGARYVDACQEELYRAQRNIDLLRNDWRLGPVRLALPGSGPMPPGYEELQTAHCSVASFMNALDGGMPFALPYSATARRQRGGGMGLSMRETVAGALAGAGGASQAE